MLKNIKMEIDLAAVWVQKHLTRSNDIIQRVTGHCIAQQDCIAATSLINPQWLNVIDLRILISYKIIKDLYVEDTSLRL